MKDIWNCYSRLPVNSLSFLTLFILVTAYARWGCRQTVQEVSVRLQECLLIIVEVIELGFSIGPHNHHFHNRECLHFLWKFVLCFVQPVLVGSFCCQEYWVFNNQVLPFLIYIHQVSLGASHAYLYDEEIGESNF